MGLSTCFGILTLQVGVTVLAAVLLTLGAVVLVANILEGSGDEEEGKGKGGEEEEGFDYPILILTTFAIGLIIVGALAFLSAYKESRCVAMLAVLGLILLSAFFIILCVLSFLGKPETVETVCHGLRCPESLWLANLDYRKEGGGGGGGKTKREVQEILDPLVSSKAMLQSSSIRLTNEIQQILVELETLRSRLQCCYKEKYIKHVAKEANSEANLDVLSSVAESGRLQLIPSIKRTNSNAEKKTGEEHSRQKGRPQEEQLQGGPPQGVPPVGVPPVGVPPVGVPPVGVPPVGVPPVGVPPVGVPPVGVPPVGVPPLGVPPVGVPPLGVPPVGVPPVGVPPLGVPPQGVPPQGVPPQGVPPQGVPEGGRPQEEPTASKGKGDDESKFKGGIPMIAAFALFIANLVFLLLSALVLYSWAQELGEGCLTEEPVYVVPQYYYY